MATGDKLVNLDDLKVAYDKQQEDTNSLKSALNDVASEDDILFTDAMEGKYHYQYLKVANRKAGFYGRQSKNINTSDSASYFDPIRIIKGQPYTFYHVYGYFSTIFYENGTKISISDQTWGASDYRISSAPDNGWAYVSVSNGYLGTAAVVGGSQHYNGESYYEGFADFQLPKLDIPSLTTAIDNVSVLKNKALGAMQNQKTDNDVLSKYINTKIQFLSDDTATTGEYWNTVYGKITTGENANTKRYAPIFIEAGKTYTFKKIYAYFTLITDANMNVVSRASDDSSSGVRDIVYTPSNDGYVFVSKNTDVSGTTMVINGVDVPESYIEGVYGKKRLADSVIIDVENCSDFLSYGYQHLRLEDSYEHRYWNGVVGGYVAKGGDSETTTRAYEPIKLYSGKSYKFINVYGYFTIIADEDFKMIQRLRDSTDSNPYTTTFTPVNDCYAFVTKHTSFQVNTMLVDGSDTPTAYIEGPYDLRFSKPAADSGVDIHVKTDGTGDYTSVVDAVDWANAQTGSYPINIMIHSGDYNILSELGGNDFISHIADSTDERQGLCLKRDHVNLIGIGYVVFRFELPDTVTEVQSTRVSCLNLREFSNDVKNITLIAKNCRYTVHDEAQGQRNIVRNCENLRCIHKGNASGLWPYPTVWGGGSAKSGTYSFINCQFLTSSYHQAWSYHSNNNTESLFFNVDGCIGSVKTSAPEKRSFSLSYYGTGRTGIETGNIKNCSGNGQCVVVPEGGSTGNNIEMYVNGWKDINEIQVTGNE